MQESHTLLNASLTLSGGANANWKLMVDCDNCTDEAYTQASISGYSFLNPPRTWSVRGGYSF
ncbi:MAG: hypothetical protein R3E75_09160 [Steroidobacteraceae bacterium]|nr:hypothetical protein [Nevskiaceae bacterium]MCP5360860.1 hypothetical protein [Nevskiaceae bacterium]MCP5466321.1 hypothetical protein [Nevskiaceae bacterium]MCP5471723.1 hypothetical protein [Nevskiaceae bacterium]